MFEDFLQSDAMIPLEKPHLEDDIELIFIHSHDSLIEKKLGDDESIIINKEALVAFTEKIKFEPEKSNLFFKVSGPGTLYLETSRDSVASLTGFLLQP